MGKIDYYNWLRGCDCGCDSRYVEESDNCNCDKLLLEISKLHTDDLILQDEIDDLSGNVYTKAEVDEKIASGGSGVTVDAYTKQESDDRFQPKGNYALSNDLNEEIARATEKENLILSSLSTNFYSKQESDEIFATKQQLSGNVADINAQLITINNEIDTKADSSALNNYYNKTDVNNLLSSKIWCGTESEYDAITTKDPEILYLIHD